MEPRNLEWTWLSSFDARQQERERRRQEQQQSAAVIAPLPPLPLLLPAMTDSYLQEIRQWFPPGRLFRVRLRWQTVQGCRMHWSSPILVWKLAPKFLMGSMPAYDGPKAYHTREGRYTSRAPRRWSWGQIGLDLSHRQIDFLNSVDTARKYPLTGRRPLR